MRSQADVDFVLGLLGRGLTASEVARRTSIPRSTVRDWQAGRCLRQPRESSRCAGHSAALDPPAYAYLLGMYLGDGCISPSGRGVWKLRITLDARYPGIAAECATAVEKVRATARAHLYARRDQRTVEVSNYWKHWPCLFPQHGPGPKHTRRIELTGWQQQIVDMHVESLIRGLIHSDGTRVVATERKGSYVRRAPRYAFRNRSEDILRLFTRSCEAAGIHCTRASPTQVAVYSKAAVARLDEFVGPKT